jgi:5-formyltetrahydrofolate cyclo-ligase
MTKSKLRKIYLGKRQMLSVAEHETRSAHIAARVFTDLDLSRISVLHCFIPILRFAEVDTRPIFQGIWSKFPEIQTVVPRVDHETGELESLKYGHDTELVSSRWQIGEPAHNDHVEPLKIDMVLVPLLCFDRRGHRVGYGRGYYDRFLRKCRPDCQKIGLSMFDEVDEISDIGDDDIALDAAVVPTTTIRFRK